MLEAGKLIINSLSKWLDKLVNQTQLLITENDIIKFARHGPTRRKTKMSNVVFYRCSKDGWKTYTVTPITMEVSLFCVCNMSW